MCPVFVSTETREVFLAIQDELTSLLAPVVESMGLVFWGLEFSSQGRHSRLRIYIDHAEGINVDQCAEVSRQISSVLDVEDPITQEYTLEVSSPGMDRPLFTLAQFAAYQGHIVQVRLHQAFSGKRKYKGLIKGVEADEVVMVVDDYELLLPIEIIDKAQVVPQFDTK